MIGRHPHHRPHDRDLDSSWIDMLAGLPKAGNRRMPPVSARGPARRRKGLRPTRSPASVPRDLPSSAPIPCGPWQPAPVGGIIFGMQRLFVEPDVSHATGAVKAVDHGHEPFDIGLRAGRPTRIEDDRSGACFLTSSNNGIVVPLRHKGWHYFRRTRLSAEGLGRVKM